VSHTAGSNTKVPRGEEAAEMNTREGEQLERIEVELRTDHPERKESGGNLQKESIKKKKRQKRTKVLTFLQYRTRGGFQERARESKGIGVSHRRKK